jgi:hypothetical protein
MTYSQEIRNTILDLLKAGHTAESISRNYEGHPSAGTIGRWKKEWRKEGILEAGDRVIHESPVRVQWKPSDYDNESNKKAKKLWLESKKLWDSIQATTNNKYIYKPKLDAFAESIAREKYHGKTIEDTLHLGIYQVTPINKSQVRTKKIDGKTVKLTSQNHIFPNSKMEDGKESCNPENVREGNAKYNAALAQFYLDPIFCDNGQSLSKSTIDIIREYNLTAVKTIKDFNGNRNMFKKYLKQEVKFRYTENDRIITSNMVIKLDMTPKGFFEAPELGIMDGPQNNRSIKAYSVPLYKLATRVGIIDTVSHDPKILTYFAKAKKESEGLIFSASKNDNFTEHASAATSDDSGFIEPLYLLGDNNNI